MAFDPDAYLATPPAAPPAAPFDPDAYLAQPKPGFWSTARSRFIPDVGEVLTGVGHMVAHPVETGKALAGVFAPPPLSIVQQGVRLARTGSPFTPEQQALGASMLGAARDPLGTIAQHPAQTLMAVLPVSAELAAAGKLGTTANMLRAAGTAVDPVALGMKTAGVVNRFAVAPAARGITRVVQDVLSPERAASNALASTVQDPQQLLNALRASQDMRVVPGRVPTAAERALEGGLSSPQLAQAQNELASRSGANSELVYRAEQQNLRAMQDQLDRINARLADKTAALSPKDAADLPALQQSLQQSIAAKQAQLDAMQTTAVNRLASPTPKAAGDVLTERARALRGDVRAADVARYNRAFELAGDARIDISPIIAQVEKVLGKPLSQFAPETAPPIVQRLRELKARAETAQPAVTDAMGLPLKEATAATPPTASLAELDAMRKAINESASKQMGATSGLAPATLGNLKGLHSTLDEVVNAAPALSVEAKDAYRQAVKVYREQTVPQFKTGVTAGIFRRNTQNQPRLLPDAAVRQYLGNESNALQFGTTFGKDPAAVSAMRQGVESMAREAGDLDKFLAKNGPAIDALDKTGMGLRQHLESVRGDIAKVAQGREELATTAAKLNHETPTALVDAALAKPSVMRQTLDNASDAGKAALAQDIMGRATRDMSNATAYLTKNRDTILDALKAADPAGAAKWFDDTLELAKWHDTVSQVKVPGTLDPNIMARALPPGKFTDAQLHDLELLVKDQERLRVLNEQARAGRRSGEPDITNPTRGAMEQASEGASFHYLNPVATTARGIFRVMLGKIDRNTAAVLARVMYENPDAAIPMLEGAIRRKATQAKIGKAAGAVGNALSQGGRAAVISNALAQPVTTE